MADENKPFQKRGFHFGKNNSRARMNKHASSNSKVLIKEDSELGTPPGKMAGFVACLNVSVASGVGLFEIVRQRKIKNV